MRKEDHATLIVRRAGDSIPLLLWGYNTKQLCATISHVRRHLWRVGVNFDEIIWESHINSR